MILFFYVHARFTYYVKFVLLPTDCFRAFSRVPVTYAFKIYILVVVLGRFRVIS